MMCFSATRLLTGRLRVFRSGDWKTTDINATIRTAIPLSVYIISATVVILSLFALRYSENLVEDAFVIVSFIVLILVPILLLGNFLGLRDKLTVLRRKKPLSTLATILVIDGILFFLFDLAFLFLKA